MLNEKLDWAKAFVKFQEKTLKPIYYFHSQQRYFYIYLDLKKILRKASWETSKASIM